MTPLILFLLGCLTVYVGAVQAAFSALMRLPLRLNAERAERHGRPDGLGHYLEDPVRLFVPARLLQVLTIVVATMLVMAETSPRGPVALGLVFGGVVAFVVACGHVVPLLVVRRDPERVLEVLLPSFNAIARGISPVTRPLIGLLDGVRRDRVDDASVANGGGVAGTDGDGAELRSAADEHEERKLLKSGRRVRRHAGAGGDDAPAGYRGDQVDRDAGRPACVVRRAAVLADPSVQRESRRNSRLCVCQGLGRAERGQPPMTR